MSTSLIVEKKNVYGVERVYPVCNKAKLFARISGNKTLLPEDIELIKKLGYNLTTESEKI
jgi:histone H3/H4